MSDNPIFWVGNQEPSISQTITADGSAVNLTGDTVTFGMRPVGGTALSLGGTTVVPTPSTGEVRFDWGPADLDTAGQYLVWWTVTTSGGKPQDMAEALIEIRDHAQPATFPGYVELEQLKAAAQLTGYTYADQDIQNAILAASRAIDGATNRRFWLDPDALQARVYTPTSYRRLMVDDLVTLTSMKIDRNGDGTFEETWTLGINMVLEPANSVADGRPYESVVRRAISGYTFPCGIEESVQVTGRFGWPEVPAGIQTATLILAQKLVKRVREAPFGIIVVGGGIDNASAVRIARNDPDVVPLIAEFVRNQPFA